MKTILKINKVKSELVITKIMKEKEVFLNKNKEEPKRIEIKASNFEEYYETLRLFWQTKTGTVLPRLSEMSENIYFFEGIPIKILK